MKKLPFIFGGAVLIGVFIFSTSSFQLWNQVSGTKVFFNGENSEGSKVFISEDGDYLVLIKDPKFEDPGQYFVYPNLRKIGVGARGWELPGFAVTAYNHVDQNVLSGTDKFPGTVIFEDTRFVLVMPNDMRIEVCLQNCP